MRFETKKALTQDLARRFQEAQTLYLTDFTGLDVRSVTELRSRFRSQGVEFIVAKNTLVRRALEGLDLPDLSGYLAGPTGIAFAAADPVQPARILKEFAREHDDRPVIKVGVVERRRVEAREVRALADLPPKDQLLAAIAGGLTAPVAGIVGSVAALIRDIAIMLEEVARKRHTE